MILVTNDDGAASPALVPLARALAAVDEVRVVVPDRERSWIGKAITRHDPLAVDTVVRAGIEIHAVSGYPADCVQLGVHSLFPQRPRLVVSGVNVGYNHGLAFLLSSGTVGAAVEGWIAGLPALAFSVGALGPGPYREWAAWAWSEDSAAMWERAAAVAADITATVLAAGMPAQADVLTVNMPDTVDGAMPRRVTGLAKVGYDRLFSRSPDGTYAHDFGGGFRFDGHLAGTDVEAAADGVVAITPIRLPDSSEVSPEERSRFEDGD